VATFELRLKFNGSSRFTTGSQIGLEDNYKGVGLRILINRYFGGFRGLTIGTLT
jgi:hypothetical protein